MKRLRCTKAAEAVSYLLLFLLTGCTTQFFPVKNQGRILQDDLSGKNLNQALSRSITYLRSQPENSFTRFADQKVSVKKLIHSLDIFQKIINEDLPPADLQKKISQQFILYQAAGQKTSSIPGEMLVTGYYQPVVNGSLVKEPPYLYPLYAVPPDLIIKKTEGAKKKSVCRLDGRHYTKYWSRKDIDTRGKAAGSELVWLKDPLDVFFLHVQGSGLIRLRDGTTRGIHYATNNGHPYKSIGKFMVKTQRISLQQASMETIRTYITNHPWEREQILFTNPSYIFFSWTKTHGALGNIGQELTPGRSIAVDQTCFPAGALGFLLTKEPVIAHNTLIGWKPVHRFVLAQDTGSAIKGPGRVDLFQGAGKEAGLAAGAMKEKGTLYFLLLREEWL